MTSGQANLGRKVENLQKVLEVTRSLAAATDLDTLLGLIINRSMELLDAERATLFLYDSQRDELISRIAAGAGEIRIPASRGIAGSAAKTFSTINVPDAYADSRFNPDVDRRSGFRTRNILAVPLAGHDGSLVGVLQVLNKRAGGFDADDLTLAETLAAQAGVAIQRANLIEHYLQKERMERAMKIAREVQLGLLPREAPEAEGFEIAGMSQPADETGGDTYDFLRLPDGRWMMIVADATGHGIGPALIVAETRAMLRAMSMQGLSIPNVLQTVNDLLVIDLDQARFVTCFFALLDPSRRHLQYASAGHGPMLFYRRQTDEFMEVPATSLPLGIMEGSEYDEVVEHQFEVGDFAVITTDGYFEAAGEDGELFGTERMMEQLRADRDEPADKMLRNLHRRVEEFMGSRPQADDLTGVIIRRTF